MRVITVLLLVSMVAACASSRGFDRGALRAQVAEQKVVTEEDIKKALDLKPQLPRPFRLAIYFSPPKSGWRYGTFWTWRPEEKDTLLGTASELSANKVISEAIVISESVVEGTDNKAIRLAAARGGTDAVLVVSAVSDIDRYNNALGATYVLLVTPFFVPGTVADGLFMLSASLWDVRNQYLYLSIESEGTATQTAPAFFINELQLVKDAKADAVEGLRKELVSRLNKMGSK